MSVDIDKERADFEASARANRYAIYSFARNWWRHGIPRHYLDTKTEAAWQLWQARAAIPQAPAEQPPQRRAPSEADSWLGLAHIICDEAGIPPGEIIRRLTEMSVKGDRAGVAARVPREQVNRCPVCEEQVSAHAWNCMFHPKNIDAEAADQIPLPSRSTGFSCPVCCAKSGEPHMPECPEYGNTITKEKN